MPTPKVSYRKPENNRPLLVLCFVTTIGISHTDTRAIYEQLNIDSPFGWLVRVVYDRKFLAGTVFFSHTNQPAVLLHEPATKQTSQPNRLLVVRS